jgi:hypothetical protein
VATQNKSEARGHGVVFSFLYLILPSHLYFRNIKLYLISHLTNEIGGIYVGLGKSTYKARTVKTVYIYASSDI